MKMKMKNRSHRYDVNQPRSKHGHKYSKYKKGLTMVILICIKQHLSNIWSLIHENAELEKSISFKKAYIYIDDSFINSI